MRRAKLIFAAIFCAALIAPSQVRASEDMVDAALHRAQEAAATGDWQTAVTGLEDARAVLPGRSATISYNLGTAYAHLGEFGWASLHLQRALLGEANAAPELQEAAAFNLGLVRQELESRAEGEKTEISPADGSWELFVGFLATPAVGLVALIAGWIGAVASWVLIWSRGKFAVHWRKTTSRLLLACGALWLFVGGAHALARTSDGLGTVIAVAQEVALHDGPGDHRPVVDKISAGSQLTVLQRAIGWYEVRMTGGLQGWLAQDDVAWLRARESEIARGDRR